MTLTPPGTPGAEWWRGAVIYQVYPRSFADGNGDGVGDLPGLLARLPYLAGLGVDGLWISPFFKSPMADFGYDVEDYRQVDPCFGTNADFDCLLARAHELGLRVIVDLVLSHTSDRHPWFQASRCARSGPAADWYVWAAPRPDGTPPNNWLSVFGGSAWTWEPRRAQYYLHNFLAAQPDLNLHLPAVQDAVLAEAEFWLARGVDGFRLDVANYYLHDPLLRDNPARPAAAGRAVGTPEISPYSYQWHVYDRSRPETPALLGRLRALMDRYPGTMTVAEVFDDHGLERAAEYVAGHSRLHTAYSFALLSEAFGPAVIRDALETFQRQPGGGWPAWAFSNHDVPRAVTRWGRTGGEGSEGSEGSEGAPAASPAFAKLLIALLTCLRGTAFLYQGEELGLPQAEIPPERLQDPYGKALWPVFPGRDGCRTPMPWDDGAPNAKFSTAPPWLPIPAAHTALSVAAQERDPASVLHFTRRFLAWRRAQPALRLGWFESLEAPAPLLAFRRAVDRRGEKRAQSLVAVFNLGPAPVTWEAGGAALLGRTLNGHGLPAPAPGAWIRGPFVVPGYGAQFVEEVGSCGRATGETGRLRPGIGANPARARP